ncbi:MAG: mucoidy inhibitor MuiA family protein [Gilvibacter sp.]
MKNITLLLLLLAGSLMANDKKPLKTDITKAIVYLEGATVFRTATTPLFLGENELIIRDLSPDILESSIQISGLNDASIRAIRYSINYLDKKKSSQEYLKIEDSIVVMKALKKRIQNSLSGFDEELKILRKNQIIHGVESDLSIEKVKQMTAYYRVRVTEIKDEIFDKTLEIEKIDKRLIDFAKEQRKLDDTKKEKRGEIHLILDSPNAQRVSLEISYNLPTAGWFPTYDIRAENTSSPIAIAYKANVYQQSGNDWDNIDIILSTGDPKSNTVKPVLGPKYVNFGRRSSLNSTAVKSESYKYNPTISKITGTVVDDSGLPLPGVNVIESGTSNGTQTDFDGNYQLMVQGGRSLVFSYVGFEPATIPIYTGNINIKLKPGAALEEIVVAAQGVRREKRALGYAVSTVYSDDLVTMAEGDVARVLSGKASGVAISSSAGSSGSASNVAIRGYNSLNGTNDALFVIDGVPFSSDGNTAGSRYLDLDAKNIASVDVIKGVAAATLYGTAGRNGVIVISTKQGNYLEAIENTKKVGLTTTRFEIAQKHSIPSNTKVTAIELDAFQLAADFKYYAAPALNENVFLTATIKNWEAFDLLAGEASIYFEGSFSGTTLINPISTDKGMEISLGIDPAIVIKRREKENFKSKSFLGSYRIIDQSFMIMVKNNKPTAITLHVEDRIPVSQNKEIKIEDITMDESDYSEKTGLILWTISLSSQQTAEKRFGYTVKFPKHSQINL